jgi:hypothetical protein
MLAPMPKAVLMGNHIKMKFMNGLFHELTFSKFSQVPKANHTQNHSSKKGNRNQSPKVFSKKAEKADREATSHLGVTCYVLGALYV